MVGPAAVRRHHLLRRLERGRPGCVRGNTSGGARRAHLVQRPDRRLDAQRRIEAIARASRHYLGDWFHSNDELIGQIAEPWVGSRPMVPDGLPLIDRVPGFNNAYVATAHGMLGVTLAPTTASTLAEYVMTGRKPPELEPFGFHPSRRVTG
ncbi:NAD(P)/FAD-dependent oxidoreductase [Nocardioides sp.]|uniref:NAD(P)/FAD-dependent oxidoreductase n=1 Tax=Nocardioides sp. TaxID=35761 RepID=UPI002F42A4BB